MNKLFKLITVALFVASAAYAKIGAVYYGVDGLQEELAKSMLNEMEDEIGFVSSDPHEKINEAYKKKYGYSTLDTLNFFGVTADEDMFELISAHPKLGIAAPFNFFVYKLKEEKQMWIGHLSAETMADMAGLQDPKLRAKFSAVVAKLDRYIVEKTGVKTPRNVTYKALPEQPLMEFEYEFDGDVDEFVESFQENYEGYFEEKGYIIAGFKHMNESWADLEMGESPFQEYWSYSLCHFKFSNSIFNKGAPDAGVFAPCTVYMYIPKGENKLYVGMSKLENWIHVTGITDPEKIKSIRDLDKEIAETMEELRDAVSGDE
jgi:uncharacterized protein (DUF302 family)